MAAASLVFVDSVILHNLISALLQVEEPVFFFLAVLGAPMMFVAGALGSLYYLVKRRVGS
jgi:hypothetical protein